MIINSSTAAIAVEAAADTAKPIPTSRRGTDMTKRPVTHTPNKPATPTLHSPLHHNKPMEGDSNREATRADTVKLRQRMLVALLIQPVPVRRAAATVMSMPRTIVGR